MALLRIDSSLRGERSLTRQLTDRFTSAWHAQRPDMKMIERDLAVAPPPLVTPEWISAAFTPETDRNDTARALMALSDEYLAEVERASIIVMGVPMYNYGMPAALKCWFDHVIRIGRTFSFDLGRGDFPLEPILAGKILVILSAHGEFGFAPGGVRATMNHLTGHVQTCSRYLGVDTVHSIAIEYQEFGDDRHLASVGAALVEVDALAAALAAAMRPD
jgi:FMN-dependent NADH-azoreductase